MITQPVSYSYWMNGIQIIDNYSGKILGEVLVYRRYKCRDCGKLLASGAECDCNERKVISFRKRF